MSIRVHIAAALLAFILGTSPALAEPAQIGWDALAPAAETYENPFADLEPDQLEDLRAVLQARSAGATPARPEMQQEAEAATARLEAGGLDVDWLFAQRDLIMEKRERAATGIRPEIVGQDIRMPGYVLPLDLRDGKAVEFLLVPTVGACIHTPPPPANQMVHVRYPEGVEIEGLFSPVWIRGTMMTEETTQTVRYVDGQSQVDVSYAMSADLVEPYQ